MQKRDLKTGDIVKARYKTGEYAGRLLGFRGENMGLIEILAVLTHPTQGDLHHPNVADVPLFHERPALSFHEKAVVQRSGMTRFEGGLPDYHDSLKKALQEKKQKLSNRDDEWARASLEKLNILENDYFKS